jgi:dCMP deaminase
MTITNYMENKNPHVRPSWDEYFLQMLPVVATRATCDRGRSGSVIVREKRIICTGYVGAPPGQAHCDEAGHLMWKTIDDQGVESDHCVRTVHAEANAIYQAARFGLPLKDATLYCHMEPCYNCAMAIISAGIKRVVCDKRYHKAERTRKYFNDAGVELVVLHDEVENYK